jgi:hypothetical protein
MSRAEEEEEEETEVEWEMQEAAGPPVSAVLS